MLFFAYFNLENLVTKLSSGCDEIHIRCNDTCSSMLHVTLTPRSSILPGSLNVKVMLFFYLLQLFLINFPTPTDSQ